MRDFKNIPARTINAIIDYVINGRRGDFITALTSNDLKGVLRHADTENLVALWATVTFLENRVPAECWGSELISITWKGIRKKLDGVVIPAESIDRIIADWRENAIKGTVLDQ